MLMLPQNSSGAVAYFSDGGASRQRLRRYTNTVAEFLHGSARDDTIIEIVEPPEWSWMFGLMLGGNKSAARSLLTEFGEVLEVYFSLQWGVDKPEALVQRTLISVMEKRHTHAANTAVLPWLITIADYRVRLAETERRRSRM